MFGRWGLQWRNLRWGCTSSGGGSYPSAHYDGSGGGFGLFSVSVESMCACVCMCVCVFRPQNLSELNVLGWYMSILGPLNTYPIITVGLNFGWWSKQIFLTLDTYPSMVSDTCPVTPPPPPPDILQP